MEIEIIPEENTLPLKTLLDYINENIYSKMSAKDVKEIKSGYLGGKLVQAIDKYTKAIVFEKLTKERETTEGNLNNYRKIIEGLRSGEDQTVYRERSDHYVGD